jgi:radical SAM superfamily enzyme YgiQ (UPF0313 family)
VKKHLLLINPWIYDFAAFDLWMKPMGLLYLAGHLRQHGYAVFFIDCLDRYNPELLKLQGLSAPRVKEYGVGKFFRQRVPKPVILQNISSPYRRYGISEKIFVRMLNSVPEPNAILVTSMMTYWYPGVFRAIELVKQHFPGVPVLLGGVYATFCTHHAQVHSQADYVVRESDPARIIRLVDEITGKTSPCLPQGEIPTPHPSQADSGLTGKTPPYPPRGGTYTEWRLNFPLEGGQGGVNLFDTYPAFDLYEHWDYGCLMTSIGCPYRCTYCASNLLYPHFIQRSPDAVFQELLYLYKELGIRNIAFYDDALLVRSADHIEIFMKKVIDEGLSCYFHTPNGLHARYITEQVADLMFKSGFKTVRLSLETVDIDRQKHTGGKVTGEECKRAVELLKRAGFQGKQIGVYLFIGLPGQNIDETKKTICYVHDMGVNAHLCEYSPIPGTKDWEILEQQGYVSPDNDPLVHNNSVFIFLKEHYTFEQIQDLKDWVRSLNRIIKAE